MNSLGLNNWQTIDNIIFHKYISSVTVTQAVQSDLGITIGTGVSVWADQTTNGKNYTQPTSAQQPAYGSTLLNGYAVLTFDGVDDQLNSALITPTPSVTPTYTCFVGRQITYVASAFFLGDAQTGANFPRALNCNTPSPRLQLFNGGSVLNSAAVVGSWFFFECFWNNATTDFLKIGATNSTGVNSGNLYTSTGRMLAFSGGTGSVHGNIELAMILHTAGLPSVAERAILSKAVTQKYGSLVGV